MLKIVWHNIRNRPSGSLAVVGIVMLIASVLFLGFQLIEQLDEDLERQQLQLGADLMLIPQHVNHSRQSTMVMTPLLNIYFPLEEGIEQISPIEHELQWLPQFYLQNTRPAEQNGDWYLVGTNWAQDFILRAWHQNYDSLELVPKQLLVGADWIGQIPGELDLFGEKFMVVDKLPVTGTDLDQTVLMSLEDAWLLAEQSPQLSHLWQVREWGGYNSPQGLASAILIKAKNSGDLLMVQQLTEQTEPAKAISGSTVLEATKGHLVLLKNVFYVFGMMLWLISIVLLIISFTSRLVERKQELGMLIALGARKKHLYQLLILEVGLLAVVGVGIGSLIGIVSWVTVGNLFFAQAGFGAGLAGIWQLVAKLGVGGLTALLAPLVAVIFPVYYLSRWEIAQLLNQKQA